MSEDNKDDYIKKEENNSELEKQSEVDENNSTKEENPPSDVQNQDNQPNVENISTANENSDKNLIPENQEASDDKQDRQVIHKKDGRLHIYIRQDKYKGELKSKNWVGRLYIDGKQKISSSGTPNLEEAIPILEKWFDDIHAESEKLKKQAEENQTNVVQTEQQNIDQQSKTETSSPEVTPESEVQTKPNVNQPSQPIANQIVENKIEEKNVSANESTNKEETNKTSTTKEKFSNLFGKLKNIKLKKPSLDGIKLPKSPSIKKNNSLAKILDFFKTKIGKSSMQGEEIVGVELNNKSIRLAQINADKSNQWVLEKFYTHKVDIPDESSVLENAEKITAELTLAIQKSKTITYQSKVSALLADAAAENAAAQFNAKSENEVNMFFAELGASIENTNMNRLAGIEQFNVTQKVAVDQFNAQMETTRDQFNANMQVEIDQSNAVWRRNVNTRNNAQQNEANRQNALNLLGIQQNALNQLWQKYRDKAAWVVKISENARDRAHNAAMQSAAISANAAAYDQKMDDFLKLEIIDGIWGT